MMHKQQVASLQKPTVGHGIVFKRTGTVEAGKENPECCAQKLAAVYLCKEIPVSRTAGLALFTNTTGMNVQLILLTCLHLTPRTPCIFYIPKRFALKVFNTSRQQKNYLPAGHLATNHHSRKGIKKTKLNHTSFKIYESRQVYNLSPYVSSVLF